VPGHVIVAGAFLPPPKDSGHDPPFLLIGHSSLVPTAARPAPAVPGKPRVPQALRAPFLQRFHSAFASPLAHILIEHEQDWLKLLGCYVDAFATNEGENFEHILG
jgi:hypothetical protein